MVVTDVAGGEIGAAGLRIARVTESRDIGVVISFETKTKI